MFYILFDDFNVIMFSKPVCLIMYSYHKGKLINDFKIQVLKLC